MTGRPVTIGGNRYDLRELAGAFGELGTLVPFVVGYVTITGLDPVGIFVAFGVSLVAAGLYFRTPVPVQPMKAVATAAINHPATVTADAIGAASLFTAAPWLVMGCLRRPSRCGTWGPATRPGSCSRPPCVAAG